MGKSVDRKDTCKICQRVIFSCNAQDFNYDDGDWWSVDDHYFCWSFLLKKNSFYSSNFVFLRNCNGVFSTQVNLHMGDLQRHLNSESHRMLSVNNPLGLSPCIPWSRGLGLGDPPLKSSMVSPRHEPEGDFRERLEEAPGGGAAVTSQAVQQLIFFNHRKRGEVEGGWNTTKQHFQPGKMGGNNSSWSVEYSDFRILVDDSATIQLLLYSGLNRFVGLDNVNLESWNTSFSLRIFGILWFKVSIGSTVLMLPPKDMEFEDVEQQRSPLERHLDWKNSVSVWFRRLKSVQFFSCTTWHTKNDHTCLGGGNSNIFSFHL